ncbi:MAG: radical SAM protein, partial [Candidatus Liptonbacteria bacterium]|nr:radical SAM protein [Candidatus Liptonbacteria bacterium]
MKIQNSKIIDAVVAVTYLCNSRCIMCNIWQIKDLPTLKAEEYLKLPPTLQDVNISGGEPFMRPELPQIIANIVKACPKAKIIISTNGFSTQLIVAKMKEIIKIKPDIGVSVSIDGIGEKHYEVRRIPQGFEKCLETLKQLKEIGVKRLRIGFTAGDYNIDHMSKMYDLARELKVEMTLAAVHNSENYFQITTNKVNQLAKFEKEIKYVIKQELKSFSPKRWLRAYFAYGLLYYVKNHKRILPSYCGSGSMYLDPDGWVFPADISTRRMGNLKDFKSVKE